ncbi:MAG: PGDYG protein [Podoviridae sp. ctLUJ1]|nr:MAG: PGDYG protein [Podoviridae sp. ctLUJ1]
MAKFQKKPVVVEAMQFHGQGDENATELLSWMGNAGEWDNETSQLEIHTLEGIMTASEGDWIIKGVNGEFYPCKPDIFEKTYGAVDTCTHQLDHIDRVVIEHTELMAKLVKLNEFIEGVEFKSLESRAQLLLSLQAAAMGDYAKCLHGRLTAFGCIQFTGSNWPKLIDKFNGGIYQDDNTFLTPDGKVYLIGQWVR